MDLDHLLAYCYTSIYRKMKRVKRPLFLSVAFLFLTGLSMAQPSTDSDKTACITCAELKNLMFPEVAISEATQVEEPVSHCKISGTIGKEINFELLLPKNWNSRFVMGGGGGFVGSVQNMASSSIKDGYATAGTDTGHKGNGIKADWALDNM